MPESLSRESAHLLTVLADELAKRGWRPGVTEAGQVLWTKGQYVSLPVTAAVSVELRIERDGTDEYLACPAGHGDQCCGDPLACREALKMNA